MKFKKGDKVEICDEGTFGTIYLVDEAARYPYLIQLETLGEYSPLKIGGLFPAKENELKEG